MSIAIEIGGSKLQIATGDPKTGTIHELYRYQVDKAQGASGILEQIEQTLWDLHRVPKAIGIGFGGPLNHETGTIATSHQIGGWSDFELKKWVQERYDVPVVIDNDANAAALGEALFGVGRTHKRVFYITLGSGVGGGMVINRALYHGTVPGEAEVGQLALTKTGATLESLCSGWALDAKIRALLPELDEQAPLKQLVGNHTFGEARFLLPAIQQKDELAIRLLLEHADNLAWGLSHVAHLFHPDIIVLGGGVSLIGEPLRAAVQQALPKYLVKSFQPGPEIALAELREEVVLVGALCMLNF
ncbi:ROK family protein [Haliscomenobacter sp.]|uniref:ROK family protein n=1 Tax=Haliscomenobacter sp. TaxID=2717303 RepID=UPI00336523A1